MLITTPDGAGYGTGDAWRWEQFVPEGIAAVLNVPVRVVQACMNLLVGIHLEAAALLKDKNMTPKTLHMLRRVKGVRQVEIAELMVAANDYTTGYVEALILEPPITSSIAATSRRSAKPCRWRSSACSSRKWKPFNTT